MGHSKKSVDVVQKKKKVSININFFFSRESYA